MLPLMPFRILLPALCRNLSAGVRKWLAEHVPWPALQRVKRTVDTMDVMAHEIYDAKMGALRAGEEAVVQQIGEGKDIISKLCECVSSSSRWFTDEINTYFAGSKQCKRTWLPVKKTSCQTTNSLHRSRELVICRHDGTTWHAH